MSVFPIIMAAFLATSLFQAELPQHETYSDKPPEQIVNLFHKNCQAFLNLPKFQRSDGKGSRIHGIVKLIKKTRKTNGKKSPFSADIKQSETLSKFTKLLAPQVERLLSFYDDVCINPTTAAYQKYELKQAVALFDKISKELPDHNVFDEPLPQMTLLQDREGNTLSHIYREQNRRLWTDIEDIPDFLQKAYVAIEDKNFFQHKGIDQTGLVRAFISSLSSKLQGGSTITQQLAKNLFFKNDLVKEQVTKDPFVKMKRKIKEIIIASRIEKSLKDKKRILGYYLNLIYLGRNSWGVKAASQVYFGRELHQLNRSEMAFLAALPRGPNNYEPMLFKKRALARRDLVLNAMVKAQFIKTEAEAEAIKKTEPRFIDFTFPNKALYVNNHFLRDSQKITGIKSLTEDHYVVRSTIHGKLQTAVESALQKGLVQFEKKAGKQTWRGPLSNIARYLDQKDTDNQALPWQMVFKIRGQKFNNVHYKVAVVLNSKGRPQRLGFLDSSEGSLQLSKKLWRKIQSYHRAYRRRYPKGKRLAGLQYGDIIYVEQIKAKKFRLVPTPNVQGAAVVMDVHNGEILALTSGFSFRQAPFNRAIYGKTHPGSALKPFTYMMALDEGYQPNILIPNKKYFNENKIKTKRRKHLSCKSNKSCVLVPGKRGCSPWPVKNYGRNSSAPLTMRRCLESSKNLCIANLLQLSEEGRENTFQAIRETLRDFEIFDRPGNCYPLLLGGQATSVLRMARAYSAIANGGTLIEPQFFETITGNISGVVTPQRKRKEIGAVQSQSLTQLRYIMQGVLARGTAKSAKKLSDFVAGKTGTSDNNRSAWFMGFSKDIVVGVYLAYDKGKGLGRLGTGGQAALPIAQKIFEKSSVYKKLGKFPEENSGIQYENIDYLSGRKGGDFSEMFRIGADSNFSFLVKEDPVFGPSNGINQDFDQQEEPQQTQQEPDFWKPPLQNQNEDPDERFNSVQPRNGDGQYEDDPFADDRQIRRKKKEAEQNRNFWDPPSGNN